MIVNDNLVIQNSDIYNDPLSRINLFGVRNDRSYLEIIEKTD
jgi:hypothetical protein